MPNDTTSNVAPIEIAISHADGLGDALAVELGFFGGAVISTQKSLTMARFALADFYRFCLHTRVASRILLPIATLALDDGIEVAEAVYQAVRGVDFSRFINIDEAFWLRVVLDTKVQANQQFTTLRLKDGIVDGFYQNLAHALMPIKMPMCFYMRILPINYRYTSIYQKQAYIGVAIVCV